MSLQVELYKAVLAMTEISETDNQALHKVKATP